MIFDNMDFHNVEEMEQTKLSDGSTGYTMWRIPGSVREKVNERIRKDTASFSSGIELRFQIVGDSVDVYLQADEAAEAQVAYLYYGSFQGGWEYSSKMIYSHPTCIHIIKAKNLQTLQKITADENLPFDPQVVRIVLPYGHCHYLRVEGEVLPPAPDMVPKKTYLAYGSSITHGSLALAAPYTYPFRIAQKLGCDYLNLGFAGTAQLEKAMAEYIVSRKDWSFASVEMGINMLNDSFSVELFEERVAAFTEILAGDGRPVFATNVFRCNGGHQEKAKQYREIVRKYADGKLIFTDGLEILNKASHISADLTHPTLEGVEQIVDRWGNVMAKMLAE